MSTHAPPVARSPVGLRRVAKRLVTAADSMLPQADGIVVLAYHRVGGRTASPVDLPTAHFRRQMEYLASTASITGIDAAIDLLVDGRTGPPASPPPVVVTFDDGTADFADTVLPVLVDLGIPATLYLATAHLDTGRPFPAAGQPLSWDAVRECASSGLVTIGAHTHNHRLLDRCRPLDVDLELDVCDRRIAEELGERPAHFAYPKAVAGSPYADGAVRSRYRTAAVAGTRANKIGDSDPFRLRRSPIQVADAWDGFVRKVEGGMGVEDDLRRIANRVRYRGRTS